MKVWEKVLFLIVILAVVLLAGSALTPPWKKTGADVFTAVSGNVGIGTKEPKARLHLAGTLPGMYIQSTDETASSAKVASIVSFLDSAGAEYAWFGDGSGTVNYMSIYAGPTHGLSLFSGGQVAMWIPTSGMIGIGTTDPKDKLHVAGTARIDGDLTVTGKLLGRGQDVAEWVPTTEKLESGTVVVIDRGAPNHVIRSASAYDSSVAGVVTAEPGIVLGEPGDSMAMIATTGRVRVNVDGPVAIGDLLVTSAKPGVAMRSQPLRIGGRLLHQPGTILGKALESTGSGQGKVLVLLSLQ